MSARTVAILLLLGASIALAQHTNDYLYPIREGGKLGFVNRAGTVVVAPQFDGVGEWKEGRMRVTAGRLSGYIDLPDKVGWVDVDDRLAFPLRKYDDARGFSRGLARIKLDDLYGYLDRPGNLAIKNKYPSAQDFDHDLALVESREGIAYIDTKGTVVWRSSPRPKLQIKE
ncbi:MAG TPA: WG repeat-containing protein [Bryobacteraceae bacterium]|jgi:hypothetical protein|nr:WG repeat-containing protein [Bryobacteraceae bacterium]